MASTLEHLCLFLIFLFLLQITRGKRVCDTLSCGEIDVQFPFGLKGSNQDPRCSYPNPSFQLSCENGSQAILTLPHSGNWVVNDIDYEAQTIQVNDPDGCLPKRFLQNLSLFSDPPFMLDTTVYDLYNLTFLRCPPNNAVAPPAISCLSHIGNSSGNSSSSVMVSWPRPMVPDWCEVISSVLVPVPNMEMPMWPFWPDLNGDFKLTWTEPRCGHCAASGLACGFAKDKSLRVGCFSGTQNESQGLPRSAKYGLAIGVGIPGLVSLLGLWCFICGKVRVNAYRRQPITELPTSISQEPMPFVMGLDGATIEKYPKTLLGESGRLLKPSDNTCTICLSEYQPKETLRTIPECNHYFHAHCIDAWLKMNGTCPLCRNSPAASSRVAPSLFSSLSLTSSLTSSP